MSRLELRLLGGFEARLDDETLAGFESQKARALLAYVSLHRDQTLERDVLAGLLWGERSDESARRNLRQALYSIRTALAAGAAEAPQILLSEQRQLRLNPEIECWTDVEAFQEAYEAGSSEAGPDPRQLSNAATLYKGDFLAGFFLRDSPGFEDWLIARQEELREEAIEIFRTLVSAYLARGEYRYGIRYARRLLAVDPLSEEAHRQLMRLYAMAGRRSRALAQYEHLMNLLQDELGVAPMEETTELYRSILLADRAHEESQEEAEPPAPLIPLVGRSDSFALLQQEWERVLAGNGRVTAVVGEAGIGKSRLVKSFVDSATSKREAVVLRGSCYGAQAKAAYRPLTELIGGALNEIIPDEDLDDDLLESPYVESLRHLAAAAGQFQLATAYGTAAIRTAPARVAMGLLELMDLLCTPRIGPSRPMIVLLEDLQWADPASLEVVRILGEQIVGRQVWMLVTSRDPKVGALPSGEEQGRLFLNRLSAGEIEEIASSLVELSSIPVLTNFLVERSEGLPLEVAELVNMLWDEGKLHPRRPGAWELAAAPTLAGETDFSLTELIQRRIRALPTSARRLLAVAAIYGHQFDVEVLQQAADEHLGVVEISIELALERWLIRQFPRTWSPAGLERDIVLWARGARRGYFEFSHDAVRESILAQINPIRRAVMHRDLALALEAHHGDRARIHAEDLAFHWLAAQEFERALPWLEAAAERAHQWGSTEIRDEYVNQALKILGRLERGTASIKRDIPAIRERLLELGASDEAAG